MFFSLFVYTYTMKIEYDPFVELFKHNFKDNKKAAHYLRKYIALILLTVSASHR